MANLIAENGGTSIVPCIAPYSESRKYFREECEKFGKFIEIYISTPLEECEKRDVKGLYKLVREGKIKNFTGINDPYEIPENPDIIIDTSKKSILECIDQIFPLIIQ